MGRRFLAGTLAVVLSAVTLLVGLAQPAQASRKAREKAWRYSTYAGTAGTAAALAKGKGTWALIGGGATLLSYSQWRNEIRRRHNRRGSYADYRRYRANWYRHHRRRYVAGQKPLHEGTQAGKPAPRVEPEQGLSALSHRRVAPIRIGATGSPHSLPPTGRDTWRLGAVRPDSYPDPLAVHGAVDPVQARAVVVHKGCPDHQRGLPVLRLLVSRQRGATRHPHSSEHHPALLLQEPLPDPETRFYSQWRLQAGPPAPGAVFHLELVNRLGGEERIACRPLPGISRSPRKPSRECRGTVQMHEKSGPLPPEIGLEGCGPQAEVSTGFAQPAGLKPLGARFNNDFRSTAVHSPPPCLSISSAGRCSSG